MSEYRDVFRVHHLLKKKSQFTHLGDLINATFLEVLEKRKIISREKLRDLVVEELRREALPDNEENRREYLEALADYFFATRLSPAEVENYINLARKREKSQTLSMVVNRDQATSMEIFKALREFCEIPMGEVYISPEEAIGIREGVLNRDHVGAALEVHDRDVGTVGRLVDAPASAGDPVGPVVVGPQDPLVGFEGRVDLALVPDVVAAGDHVHAGREQGLGGADREPHAPGQVLAVGGDEVDPVGGPQLRQDPLDRLAAGLPDDVADHQDPARPGRAGCGHPSPTSRIRRTASRG